MTAGRPGRVTDAERDAANERRPLSEVVASSVALVRKGREHTGLCPFHNERSPSFTVRDDKGFFHCFGCGAHGDAIAFVMRTRALSYREAVDWLLDGARLPPYSPGSAPVASGAVSGRRQVEIERSEQASRILSAGRKWEEARPITAGDPVDRYLRGRAIALDRWPDVLRSHPRLGHGWDAERRAYASFHTAMIARVTNVRDELVGIHRVYLRVDGGLVQKAAVDGVKKVLGPVNGGAIRLFPPRDGADGITEVGLAEGIETALAAHVLTGWPVWSCIDGSHMVNVELPFEVGRVVIFADADRPQTQKGRAWMPEGVGLHDARKLAARLARQAVKARIIVPQLEAAS